jgi:hypothetical protein
MNTALELIELETRHKSLAEALSDKNRAINAYASFLEHIADFIHVPADKSDEYREQIAALATGLESMIEYSDQEKKYIAKAY